MRGYLDTVNGCFFFIDDDSVDITPSTTEAVSYFRWIDLHKSTIRPRTLEMERRRMTIIAKRKGKKAEGPGNIPED